MTKKATESPMMAKYNELKKKHPDALILFRCGDFYETYCDDASAAAAILGITLTRRKNGEETINMAGFPFNALDTYLPKLIRAGKRVAICDQIEGQQKVQEIVKPTAQSGDAGAQEQAEKAICGDNRKLQDEINELEAELAEVRKAARAKITEIIKTTLLSGVTITANLDNYYASYFDRRLDYILLKRVEKITLNETDIAYLITAAGESMI